MSVVLIGIVLVIIMVHVTYPFTQDTVSTFLHRRQRRTLPEWMYDHIK